MRLSNLRFSAIFLTFLLAMNPPMRASEIRDRWEESREEEIKAKQAKIDDLKSKIEVLTRQAEEERKTTGASQEKIWKEYKDGVEAERKTLQDQLKTIEGREQLFENELQKRREQDELRIQEKQEQVKSLITQVDFLAKQIAEDRKNYEEQSQALREAETKNIKKGASPYTEVSGAEEILQNGQLRLPSGQLANPAGTGSKLAPVRNEYYLEIGDVLAVDVWRVPDLSRSVTVRPDGRISMPIVGDIDVLGLSLIDLREILTKKFSEYVWNPQVSISITQFGGRKFVILGEVKGPGVYRFQQDLSLIEALALAGGFSETAKRGKVMIIRGDIHKDPQVKMINANVENILKQGMLSENLTILPNDIIYITKDFLGDYKDVIKNVISPTLGTGTDFLVFRSALRTAQGKRN